jgi:hypothetical protein
MILGFESSYTPMYVHGNDVAYFFDKTVDLLTFSHFNKFILKYTGCHIFSLNIYVHKYCASCFYLFYTSFFLLGRILSYARTSTKLMLPSLRCRIVDYLVLQKNYACVNVFPLFETL